MSWRAKLQKLIPTREQLQTGRFTRWLAPWLGDRKLWHWSRRGVALGVAIGIFFGLLVPFAQIPLAATASIALRANIPAAMTSTLITNPVTFAPIYYMAYRTGLALTGAEKTPVEMEQDLAAIDADLAQTEVDSPVDRPNLWQRMRTLGTPLLVGLGVFAVLGGVLAYVAVSLVWGVWILLKRRQGRRMRSSKPVRS